jgi:hypothetical protein
MSDSQGPRIPGEERSRRGLTAGRIILVLVILALLALLIPLACQALRGSDTEEQTSQGNSQESTEETTGLESAAGGAASRDEEAQTASAEISALEDQSGNGTTLTVGSATISGTDGWIAVHRDDGSGKPQVPQSIGQAPLRESENTDVVVTLDEPVRSSQTLYAMIHADDPADGRYTFPNGDPPVEVNGKVVVEPLQYTIVDRADARLPDSGGISPMALPLTGAALIALVSFTLRSMRATR